MEEINSHGIANNRQTIICQVYDLNVSFEKEVWTWYRTGLFWGLKNSLYMEHNLKMEELTYTKFGR